VAFDFPNSPATNATVAGVGGVTYTWDGTKWVNGTVPSSALPMVGLTGSTTDVLPTGTYDLGPVLTGGTVLNSYAHVASGTLTYTGAIGQPGTYTPITGLNAITSNSTTIDTVGTATAANVLSAGQHLWCIVSGTAATGATVFFSVKVP